MARKFQVLTALLVLALLFSFSVACTGSDEATVTKGSGEATSGEGEAPADSGVDKKNLAIGDSVEISGTKVTVTAVADGGKGYDDKALLKVSVSYENNSKETASFNVFDWSMEDANGARSDLQISDNEDLGSGDLAPGGKKTGDVYLLAEGATKIVYSGNIFGGEDDLVMWNVK